MYDMSMYTRKTRKAKKLMTDDWFKIGGTLYRVIDVARNDFDETVIRFIKSASPGRQHHILIVPKNTLIKVWNQK